MNGQDLTKSYEGCTLVAIKDSRGVEIGWGHNSPDIQLGMTWTQSQADQAFDYDYGKAMDNARRILGIAVWSMLNEPRKAVVADMIYELGPSGFSAFKQLIAAIDAGNYSAAEAAMLDSLWAKQVPNRANQNAKIMLTGEWPNGQ